MGLYIFGWRYFFPFVTSFTSVNLLLGTFLIVFRRRRSHVFYLLDGYYVVYFYGIFCFRFCNCGRHDICHILYHRWHICILRSFFLVMFVRRGRVCIFVWRIFLLDIFIYILNLLCWVQRIVLVLILKSAKQMIDIVPNANLSHVLVKKENMKTYLSLTASYKAEVLCCPIVFRISCSPVSIEYT